MKHTMRVRKSLCMTKQYEQDMKAEWTVMCSCGWHTHIVYPTSGKRVFEWHLKEEQRVIDAFEEVVKTVRNWFTPITPEGEKRLGELLESLDESSEDSREVFLEGIVFLLEAGDIKSHDMVMRALHGIYVFPTEPRTKKVDVSSTAKALFPDSLMPE